MNTRALIARFGIVKQITRTTGTGAYNQTTGLYVPGTTESVPLTVSIQPFQPEKTVIEDGGDRNKTYFRLYCADDIKAVGVPVLKREDRVTIEGLLYQVESVERWPGYVMAIVASEGEAGS